MLKLNRSWAVEDFLPLPTMQTASGRERRTGVEIEFGGLDEDRVADLVVGCFGGRHERRGANAARVAESGIGSVEIVLDTAFREKHPSHLKAAILELSRSVVPVEIVTEPLPRADLHKLEALRGALREAGATGSREGMLLGFGVHLNPEVAGLNAEAIVPVLRAYGLLEDWLRHSPGLDHTRRLLPFVDPYPRRFLDLLAEEAGSWDMSRLVEAYLDETPSRNRGLDLLPLLRHLDEKQVVRALGDAARSVSARPAFHYRLPDSRVDEPDWRLAHEWNRWRLVEVVAADAALLARLAEDWLHHHRSLTTIASDWRRHVEDVLAATQDPLGAVAV